MADPITAEQVARAIEAARSDEGGISDALGGWQWDKRAPDYVRVAWGKPSLPDFIAALTRWHAELVAAETPRKVARWDAEAGLYALSPGHPLDNGSGHIMEAPRANAIAWGYTIEGGPAEDSPERLPARCGDCKHYDGDRLCKASTGQRFTWGSYEPASWCPLRFAAKADDTAPERLKARREALGWSMTDAALVLGGACDERDIGHYEAHDDACCMPLRTRYAAALSAAEAERMTAVGAWAKYGTWEASHLEPTSPPAPEVVDVPQPAPLPKTVAHFYTIRALPEPHRVSWNMPGDGPQWVRVNDALWLHVDDLRAMLADIDAQQGGAS